VTAEILLGIVTGLLANELCEFGPWCARKLIRWSAFRRYTDPGRAEMRAEELTALINDRPGNLFKLITAVCFAADAIIVCGRRAIAREPDAGRGSDPALPALTWQVAIQVEALDRSGLLSAVTRVLSEQHVNILSASVTTGRDRVAVSRFTFEMGDPKHVGDVLRAVRAIDDVHDVYRVTS
jgi:predicted amino acid-binding ACT domain protein